MSINTSIQTTQDFASHQPQESFPPQTQQYASPLQQQYPHQQHQQLPPHQPNYYPTYPPMMPAGPNIPYPQQMVYFNMPPQYYYGHPQTQPQDTQPNPHGPNAYNNGFQTIQPLQQQQPNEAYHHNYKGNHNYTTNSLSHNHNDTSSIAKTSISNNPKPKRKFDASKSFVPSKPHDAFLKQKQQHYQPPPYQQPLPQALQQPTQFIAPQVQKTAPQVPMQDVPLQVSGHHHDNDTLIKTEVVEVKADDKEEDDYKTNDDTNDDTNDNDEMKETRLKFITTTEEISPNGLKIPLIIESNSKKANNEETHFITTTITSSSVDKIDSKPVVNGNVIELIFKVNNDDEKFEPLIFGTTLDKFLEQKKKFVKDEFKEVDDNAEEEIEIEAETIEDKPIEQMQWATIAQKAVEKQPKQSNSNSSSKISTTTSLTISSNKKEDIKLIPTISNVLEPLGSVVLKLMFDKSFQNHYTSTISKSKIPKIIPRGLVNTGNICFMSSILQLLLYCKPFYQTLNIISNKTIQSLASDSKFPLFESVVSLYKYFNIDTTISTKKKFGDSITPTDFYKSISSNERFQHLKWGQQEDAEEFLGYLIDGLHEEFILSVSKLNQFEAKNLFDSIVNDEYRSIIKNELKKYNDNNNEDDNNDNDSDDGWKEVGASKTSSKRTVEIKSSPITQLFGGSFRSVLNLPKQKESQSITLDPFQQIQLDISSNDIETLEDAFKKISEIEEIPSYKLNNGNEIIAKKQTFIDKLPEVLVIHLKRFAFTNNESSLSTKHSNSESSSSPSPSPSPPFGKIEKICKKIEFNHDLKIPEEIISSTTKKFNSNYLNELNYKLIGVVYHIGKNSDGGHYTVDVLHENNEWLSIDDTLITELKPENVLNGNGHDESIKTAYILMYQRV